MDEDRDVVDGGPPVGEHPAGLGRAVEVNAQETTVAGGNLNRKLCFVPSVGRSDVDTQVGVALVDPGDEQVGEGWWEGEPDPTAVHLGRDAGDFVAQGYGRALGDPLDQRWPRDHHAAR